MRRAQLIQKYVEFTVSPMEGARDSTADRSASVSCLRLADAAAEPFADSAASTRRRSTFNGSARSGS